MRISAFVLAAFCAAGLALAPAMAQDDPDLIFKKDTTFNLLSPNSKLATYVVDDPLIDGVACYFTLPEKGGWVGWAGFAEQTSDVSLACRQVGAVKIKGKFAQGADMYEQRRSLFFKAMHISRGCDASRNVLVYLSFTNKLVDGSPKNSTSTVPIMPWGGDAAPKCSEFVSP